MSVTVLPTQVQEPMPTRTYSVKVMPQGRKNEYAIKKLFLNNLFKTVAEMKESLSSTLLFQVDNFGYIEPGHSLKGRQQWIFQEEDL